MKKILFILLSLLVTANLMAQTSDADPKVLYKKAKKYLQAFNFQQNEENFKNLKKAAEFIDQVVQADEYQESVKAWMLRGDIYNSWLSYENLLMTLNNSNALSNPEAGIKAYQSYRKAYDLAVKKYRKKKILNSLRELAGYLNNAGMALYNQKQYDKALESFEKVLTIDKLLTENGKKSLFEKEEDRLNQLQTVGLVAYQANQLDKAKEYFEMLLQKGVKDPAFYDALFKYYNQKGDEQTALKYLFEGRNAFPDNTSLLFSEINYYIQKGQLDKLIDKLKLAREKEPNNISVVLTEGNVYDNLFQTAIDSGDTAKADKYFKLAKKAYEDALAIDSNNFLALYSMGALYYNKAAAVSKELNKYASDFSAAGQKKYSELKTEMENYFQKALPFFLKAEKQQPQDINTLTALKEIYAHLNQLDKSKTYRDKIEALQN